MRICTDETHEKWRVLLTLQHLKFPWWVITAAGEFRLYSTHRLRRHARAEAAILRRGGVKVVVRSVRILGAVPPR